MHLLIIEAHNWIETNPDLLGLLTGTIGTNNRTHGEIRPGISIPLPYKEIMSKKMVFQNITFFNFIFLPPIPYRV
jgi:hypothetical protein